MRYPPLVSLINIVVRARTFAGAMDDAAGICAAAAAGDAERGGLRVLGPAPAPLGRLRGEYRAQLLIKGAQPEADARGAAGRDRRAARPRSGASIVDVDPISVRIGS